MSKCQYSDQVPVIENDFFTDHLPHTRHDVAKNSELIKMLRSEVKDMNGHMLGFFKEFREYRKEKSSPFDDKFDRARELLSPLVSSTKESIWAYIPSIRPCSCHLGALLQRREDPVLLR